MKRNVKSYSLAAFALAALLPSGCGGTPVGECEPPKPRLELIEPASAKVHSPGVLLTVRGLNFVPTSVVFFDGHALSTSYIGSQQLRAVVPLEALHKLGPVDVDVFNPADTVACSSIYQGGQSRSSNALTFTILP